MARDFFHHIVKNALIQDGWEITADPFPIEDMGASLKVDLAAEKIIAAKKDSVKIAVEIKSFLSQSIISEFNSAMGQYLGYLKIIQKKDPERTLYLAIPLDVSEKIFKVEYYQVMIKDYQIKIIVYDPIKEQIISWIN